MNISTKSASMAYAAMLTTLSLVCTSCTDEEYDLEKEISQEVSFGGEHFAIPVGSTQKLFLSDLIDIEDIDIDNDGNYNYIFNQDLDPQSFEIENVSLSPISINPPVVIELPDLDLPDISIPFGFQGDNTSTVIPLDVPIPTVDSEIHISEQMPEQIKNLSYIKLNDAAATLIVKFSDNNKTLDALKIKDMEIKLPMIFDIADSEIANNNNTLTISNYDLIKTIEGELIFEKTININGIHNIPSLENNMLNIVDNIKISGNLNIPELDITTPPEKLKLELTTTVASIGNPQVLNVESITGNVDFSESVNASISDIELPESLSGNGNQLDLINSAIEISINSTLPIPMKADMTLNTYPNTTDAIDCTLNMDRANFNGKFWISNSNEMMESGSTFINQNVSAIINSQPESIDASLKVSSVGSSDYTFNLNDTYSLDADLKVIIPMQIGSNMQFNYDLDPIDLDMSQFSEELSIPDEMKLSMNVINAIPLGVTLNINPLDENEDIISGIVINSQEIKGASVNTESECGTDSTTSAISISVSEKTKGAFGKIRKLGISISCNSSEQSQNAYLNENQFLQLTNIKAEIKGGITLDIESMNNDEDDYNDYE